MPALSREEKNNLSFHINFALSILFLLGIAIGVIGYLNIKPIMVIIGSLTSIVPVIYLMVITYNQQAKEISELRDLPLKEVTHFKSEVFKAEVFLKSFSVDGGIESCFVSRKDSINHISLVRLVDRLKEKLVEIEIKLNSNNISDIEEGLYILNSPMSFPPNSQFLIDHDMPDMHKSSWIDSLHFLMKELSQITH